jgi:hypothetical protein
MSGSLKGRIISGSLILVLALAPLRTLRAQTTSSAPSGSLQAFLLTSTYGVLAGTLTGLASLAFYEEPGDHGRNVAMGASIGLYVGLLLGAYIVYAPQMAAPSSESDDSDSDYEDDDPMDLGLRQALPTSQPLVSWDPHRAAMQVGWAYRF